jgi:hypothetical protein
MTETRSRTDRSDPDDASEAADLDVWSMTDILDCAMDLTQRTHVTVGDIVGAFGPASFVPLLLLPSMTLVSPLSGIPLFSSFCGLIIILVSLQMIAGRSCVWLPAWLRRQRLSGERLRAGLMRVRPVAAWFDRNAHARLGLLFRRPVWYLLPLACVLIAAMIPFFELVPFSSTLLGASVAMISLGMLTRDGIWVLAGLMPLTLVTALVTKIVILT